MTHKGPLGVPRPGVTCRPHIIFELDETLRSSDKDALESTLESLLDYSISVEEGISFGDGGTTDVRVSTGQSTIENETFNEIRQVLVTQGHSPSGWRIGDV